MYDIIIIGGGAAGMSAAIYAARGGMRTLLLEKLACGGQAAKTYEVDNYPGFSDAPSGPELMEAFERHLRKFDVEIRSEAVREIQNPAGAVKTVKTRRGGYETKTVIIAAGAKPKKLGIPGEEELTGAGVSWCATCDGAFFKDRDAVVIGGGNTAFEDALYLSGFCRHVFLMNRSERFRASENLVKRAEGDPKITIYKSMIPEAFEGAGRLERVIAKNAAGERGYIEAAGAIIAIGIEPDNALAEKCGIELCERGFIKTDMYLATSVPGIFAAGDCRVSPLRQIVTAAADGAVAATGAINYVLRGRDV